MPVHAVVDQDCRSENVSANKGDYVHFVAMEIHSYQPLGNIEVREARYLESPGKHGNYDIPVSSGGCHGSILDWKR